MIFDRVLKEEKPALVAGTFFVWFYVNFGKQIMYMAELTPLYIERFHFLVHRCTTIAESLRCDWCTYF